MDPNSLTQVQDAPTAIAPSVMSAATQLPDPAPQTPARAKESGPTTGEVTGFVEVVGGDSLEKEPLPPEVSSWMEKVSRDTSGEMPSEIVIAKDQSSTGAGAAGANHPVFVLPLGKDEYATARHQGVQTSVRWLAEWCSRLVKKLGDQVTFG